jgi:hypothetical protein
MFIELFIKYIYLFCYDKDEKCSRHLLNASLHTLMSIVYLNEKSLKKNVVSGNCQ